MAYMLQMEVLTSEGRDTFTKQYPNLSTALLALDYLVLQAAPDNKPDQATIILTKVPDHD